MHRSTLKESIKFNFPFYDFFVIYYNFFKYSFIINIKEKTTNKNHSERSYIRFCEFEEIKYPIFEFKVET